MIGQADGAATEARLKGEAAGLVEKAEAMKQLEGVGKEYDLAVRNIDADVQVRTAAINAQKDASIASAQALSASLANANIDIVGGTDLFVDRILGATAMGKAVDGFVNSSDTTKAISAPYASGDKDLVQTIAGALAGMGPNGIANLTLARFLTVLSDKVGGDEGALLGELVGTLKERGIDGIALQELVK